MLFYPSHDIALANGVKHFNPPTMALRLQEDLQYLSNIWNEDFLSGSSPIPIPWGWDYDTREYIHRQYGIKYTQLPSNEDLLLIRQLSSRQTTVQLCEKLSQQLPGLRFSSPTYLETEDAVFDYIRKQDEAATPFVLKTPWSSSGRGLSLSQMQGRDGQWHPVARETLMNHARTTLRKMGGIMAETWITDKRQDFAMLFRATPTEVKFIGYSFFDNDDAAGGTTYRQGYLLSNEKIEQKLGEDPEKLHRIASGYEDILTDLLRPLLDREWPLGYLGIDMMTTAQGIAPCVELNLRCTMGTVCRLWYEKHRQEGIYRVSPRMADGHFKAEFLTTE